MTILKKWIEQAERPRLFHLGANHTRIWSYERGLNFNVSDDFPHLVGVIAIMFVDDFALSRELDKELCEAFELDKKEHEKWRDAELFMITQLPESRFGRILNRLETWRDQVICALKGGYTRWH